MKSTKKRRLTQAQKEAIPKLARLKEKGLFKGNVRRPSKHGIKQTKVFEDVLSGRAAVVDVGNRKTAREYSHFKSKGKKLVVPHEAGEKVRFNRRSKELASYRTTYDRKVKTVKPRAGQELPREGKGQVYVIPFAGRRFRFEKYAELEAFMRPYETGKRPYTAWREYVEIEYVKGASADDDEDDE